MTDLPPREYPALPAPLASLRSGLVLSCQADPGSPFDAPGFIVAFARAGEIGGARAVRVREVANVEAVRAAVALPIIGLTKRSLPDSDVYITPSPEEVRALARAGATIVAFDATVRRRPFPVADLVAAAHEAGVLAFADCADLADAEAACEAGADAIGTTLSGYTPGSPRLEGPDLEFIRAAARLPRPLIAEGRVRTPEEARAALRAGAFAVVVGSAVTRPDVATAWFVAALEQAAGGSGRSAVEGPGGTRS